MTEHKFDFDKEKEAKERLNTVVGLTRELAETETRKLADHIIKEAGELYDSLYPHLKHEKLRKSFILAIFLGVQDIIVKEFK